MRIWKKNKQNPNSFDRIILKNKQMELQAVLDEESLRLRDKNKKLNSINMEIEQGKC